MARQVQVRRGTTSDHESFTGAPGEITVDTDKNTVVVHDGTTVGGFPLALESAATNAVKSTSIRNIVSLFQSAYEALDPPDPETLYVILPLTIQLDPGAIVVNGFTLDLV